MSGFTGLGFAPLIPWPVIAVLGAAGAALVLLGLFRGGRGTALRALALGVLVLALFNPRLENESREPQKDVAVIVVDQSSSQNSGDRRQQIGEALAKVREAMARYDDLDVRVIEGRETPEDGTLLFDELSRAVADIPQGRYAGSVLITDGQVFDVPEALAKRSAEPSEADPQVAAPTTSESVASAPMHVLLTGEPGERDRRLVIERSPAFGIVGSTAEIMLRVEDRPDRTPARTEVQVTVDRGRPRVVSVETGQSRSIQVPIEHGGPNIVEIEVQPMPGEMSRVNNEALVTINGVRDRLRVLLVSGQPHAGERTWRNLLKSDPSVDLVHFTILRPPEKNDFTPLNELALISFPIRELFEVKLHEFDLIVFDRYVIRFVLPPLYFENIANFVRDGGAVLAAVGPDFAAVRSLYHTPLGAALPGRPTGGVTEGEYRALLTDKGLLHPVTAGLAGASDTDSKWGRWFRVIDTQPDRGVALLRATGDRPLLLLDRYGEGRIAQFMSDHVWMWARGFDGGGPHAELIRRLSHWLMKEPDLEEEVLRAFADGNRLTIERRSLSDDDPPVTVTAPSGAESVVRLERGQHGAASAVITAEEQGLYRVGDGQRAALAVVGALNAPELSDLRATGERLGPAVRATGGQISWISESVPDIRRTRPGRDGAGQGWIGFVRNEAYIVTGVRQLPLLPAFLFLLLALGAMMLSWWQEGK
jgi:hypothetical protein